MRHFLALITSVVIACGSSNPPTPNAPASACQSAEDAYRSTQRVEGTLQLERFVDVDRDGQRECFFASSGNCGSGGCLWFGYMAGNEASFLGEFNGSHGQMHESTAFGPLRFEGFAGSATSFEVEYHYADRRYTPQRERVCRTPAGTSDIVCEPWTDPGTAE